MKNEITGMKLRLIVMNFLQFAVWGAYLTSMGTYLFNIGQDRSVLRHAGDCFLVYACHNGNYCRQVGACSKIIWFLSFYGCRVYGGCRVVWLCGW